MDISIGLAADLAALTEALDVEPRDHEGLESMLNALGNDVTSVVSSYLGMSVVILIDGQRISFSIGAVVPSATSVTSVTSLLIPLPALANELEGHLALHAATPGAFVDLAADLGYCLGETVQVLDMDVELPIEVPHMYGLDSFSPVNQATGVLMAQGHTAESARTALLTLATEKNIDLHRTALTILDLVHGAPPPPCPPFG